MFPAEPATGRRGVGGAADRRWRPPRWCSPTSTRSGSAGEGHGDGALGALPLGAILPSMNREDPFAQQLCAGLDEVLAPVVMSLDAFPAYLDLATAPADMLRWLGHGSDGGGPR